MRPEVKTLTKAKTIHKIHCGECNWTLEVVANTDADIQCCPWCGWSDLELSCLTELGGFQEIECKKHGRITVLLPDENANPDDFMDNLFCPYCA
ncbi:hypothetical protein SOASR030_00510 [Leminorella grimontii]|uniref:Cysteine-rich CPCC domain-containing protein n=1 Tax=Leminorella grimontii TaxID=82981 RepID=A0AAV5MYT1_9GAMM|nr:hypothetical protein [Leminorella grimontii]GKX53939.1 hypothetical protein SOASR030_00510 [Leminorella grimontii]